MKKIQQQITKTTYKCDYCDNEFATKSSANSHEIIVHILSIIQSGNFDTKIYPMTFFHLNDELDFNNFIQVYDIETRIDDLKLPGWFFLDDLELKPAQVYIENRKKLLEDAFSFLNKLTEKLKVTKNE